MFYYIQLKDNLNIGFVKLSVDRYESGDLIIISNQPFSQWDSIFTDSMTMVETLNRLAKIIDEVPDKVIDVWLLWMN